MPLQISRRILYRICAVGFLPVAAYNYFVWFGNPDTRWETPYLKSLVGAVTLTIASIVLAVLSVRQQDRIFTLCE
jgi:hypothetical protein